MTDDLLDYIHQFGMTALLEKARNFKSYPLAIPSYKLKTKAKLVREIDTLIYHDIPVFIFCYKDDFTESGYNKIPHGDNVTFVLIEEKDFTYRGLYYKSIQGKRSFIQDWMLEHNHKIYFICDDDCNGKVRFLISENPRKIITTDLSVMLKLASEISNYLPKDWPLLSLGCNIDHCLMMNGNF